METLEEACLHYLMCNLPLLAVDQVFEVALLADDLGLSELLEAGAAELAKRPWEENAIMGRLSILLQMTPYKQDVHKRNRLLHHPESGACTELQVLELLDMMTDIPEAEIVSALRIETLQPAELNVLLAALLKRQHDSNLLLRAAVEQKLVPEGLRSPDWAKPVRIVEIVLSSDRIQFIKLPQSGLKLETYNAIRWARCRCVCIMPVVRAQTIACPVQCFVSEPIAKLNCCIVQAGRSSVYL